MISDRQFSYSLLVLCIGLQLRVPLRRDILILAAFLGSPLFSRYRLDQGVALVFDLTV
jgi:hypothetical protein